MTYSEECQMGRDHAAQVMWEAAQTRNMPRMVQAIRDAAKDDTGHGIGFLFAISGQVMQINGRV